MANRFGDMGATVHVTIEILNKFDDYHKSFHMLGNIPVVTFSTQQYNWKMLILKRMMDIAGALAGLLITGVVTLFLAPPLDKGCQKIQIQGYKIILVHRLIKISQRYRLHQTVFKRKAVVDIDDTKGNQKIRTVLLDHAERNFVQPGFSRNPDIQIIGFQRTLQSKIQLCHCFLPIPPGNSA